ncbi:MAG: hypothetical protein ACRCXC_04740 [Legionella sp.]
MIRAAPLNGKEPNNLYVRQEIVNALSGNKTDAISVYTSNGDMKPTNENRHHQEA